MLRTGLIFVALAATDFHIELKGSEAMKLSLKRTDSMDAAAAVKTGAVKWDQPVVQPNVPPPSADYATKARAKRDEALKKDTKLRHHFSKLVQECLDSNQGLMADFYKKNPISYDDYRRLSYVNWNKDHDVQELMDDMDRFFKSDVDNGF